MDWALYRTINARLSFLAKPSWAGLAYLDAIGSAGTRLEAIRVVRDLGLLPPDAVFFLFARALLDLAANRLEADPDLAAHFADRLEEASAQEVADVLADYQAAADELTAEVFCQHREEFLARLYLQHRLTFDRRYERGRQHFFGPPTGQHAAYLRAKAIID